MCGINLIVDKNKNLTVDPIRKMAGLTSHRGPDETIITNIKSDTYTYYLAANRLKITDQSNAAAQPFFSENRKHALLFNGEIYNYYELKNELIKKQIRFTSHSDTEVMLHWLICFGKEGIPDLHGMFAFIFIDIDSGEVLLARDRFGIKALYFHENDQYFIASSEIRSITGSGLVKKIVNTRQIQHYLLYKYAKPPETFIWDIFELEHGKLLQFKCEKLQQSYLPKEDVTLNKNIPDIQKVENLLHSSLIQQLNAQVPLGLLLSGGIDSSLLLALARKEGFTMPTFSIVNSRSDLSFGTKDYEYSKLAAKTFTSEHYEIEMEIGILDQFHDFISTVDQPIGDSSYLMTSAICKNASESMKILVSGAGADELFAGYNRHRAFYHYLNNKKIINFLIPLLKPVIGSIPTGRKIPYRKWLRLLKKWSGSCHKNPEITFHNYLVFNDLKSENIFTEKAGNDKNKLQWALDFDRNNYLVSDVLALTDRASMLHGIEVRVPYLDENLVKYINGFHPATLLKYGQKWILKEILKNNGGKKFVGRPKEGFGLPLSGWLLDKRADYLWEIFRTGDNMIFDFVDRGEFDRLVNQQKRGIEDHGPLLWSILVLGHWLDRNFS